MAHINLSRMKTLSALLISLPPCWPISSSAQQEETYDY